MALDTRPARQLTSREIAKIISSQLGGLAEFCHADDIRDAMRHFDTHSHDYMKVWRQVNDANGVKVRA